MLNSNVLEVAIGLVLCYSSVALISSSIYEAIASLLKLRANTLLQGVKTLVNDEDFNGLARNLYNSALISPHATGLAATEGQVTAKPSYMDPGLFAHAMIDSILRVPGSYEDLGRQLSELECNKQVKDMLLAMYARADGEIEKMHADLARWFDLGMQRLSGSYKRLSQFYLFGIALVLSVTLNIDTLHLFRTLWVQPALVAQVGQHSSSAQAVLNLETLPIGWGTPPDSFLLACVGWLLTASSVLFGAPLWFDLLQRLANLRGTGPKPGDKKTLR